MSAPQRFDPEFRRTHLGASQVPAALGISPYERPITLWEKFRGLRAWDEGFDEADTEATDIGHALEDGIAQLAARRIGKAITTAPMQTHPRITWLVSSRDRIVPDEDNAPLECKSTGMVRPMWRESRDRWGLDSEGGDGIPTHVAAQVQTQLLVARACADERPPTHAYVAALIAGEGLRVYRVPYVDDIARAIVSKAHEFWQHVVDHDRGPPPADGSDAFQAYLKERLTGIVHPRQQVWLEGEMADELGPEVLAAYHEAKAAEEKYKALKQRVELLVGSGDGIHGPWGSVQVGYRDGKETLSQGRLREKLADMFREGVGEDAQRVAIEKAEAFIRACHVQGRPYTVVTPRHPPKTPRRGRR